MAAALLLPLAMKMSRSSHSLGWSGGKMAPRPLGPRGEIDGLLVSPGKASLRLTDNLISGLPLKSEPTHAGNVI